MRRERLIREIRRWCRRNAAEFSIDMGRGKGSHCRAMVGGLVTTIKSGELSPDYVDLVLKQLGIPKDAIRR